MPAGNTRMLRKLQSAINAYSDDKILVSQSEWYSDKRNCPVTSYVIKKSLPPDNIQRGRKKTIELFSTTSQIQAVLYLRDYWYALQGIEIPTDNEYWNNIKASKGIVIDGSKEEKEVYNQ